MNLDAVLQTFIAESRELLVDMESALLSIAEQPEDAELINAIFRAAHTIKGSAGLFGLDRIVAFTHIAESVLDLVRNGDLKLDEDLVAIMLRTGDHLSALIEALAEGDDSPDSLNAAEQELGAALSKYLPSKVSLSTQSHVEETVLLANETSSDKAETDGWHLSLRFGADLFRNGMDPVSILRYLGSLGEITHIVTLTDSIPSLTTMDPESCYLSFEINLKSSADKATLEDAFEFVQEGSRIRILPPHSKVSEYLALIEENENKDLRLGEILIACGSLTQKELAEALQLQANSNNKDQPIGAVLVEQEMIQPALVEAALVKQKKGPEKNTAQKTIRVDADKLDALINLIGELVISGAGLAQLSSQIKSPELQETAATIHRLVEEVRDSSLSLRMVQIGETFNRFHRVVRDVSKELGKDITLIVNGAETELDKSVVEKIGDPLMHLLRNSMDHGIESAEVRKAQGKSPQGRVELNAYHDSGSVVIEVRDDGGGLNRDRILAKGIERGLVQTSQTLSDEEIFNLVFEAGFSTAEQITNLSGRGVGMDVVRQNIHSLRGTVQVSSEMGKGACFTIRLPLTLAIIDGFLVDVDRASFVIPLDSVVECIEMNDTSADRRFLNLRGEVLPFISLRETFEIPSSRPERENVVVVKTGNGKLGIVVDFLQGEFQTVIKPLGNLFRHLRGIAGSTILGNGSVALILDVSVLANLAANRESEEISVRTAIN